MKSIKKIATTVTLIGIIIIGATNANAGLMMSDFSSNDNQPQPCAERTEKVDNGIIVGGFGIIVNTFGIIVNSLIKGDTPTECGIIVNS